MCYNCKQYTGKKGTGMLSDLLRRVVEALPPHVLDPQFLIAQAIGVAALSITLWGLARQERRRLLFLQSIGGVFFALHFLLLAGYVGALANFLVTLRNPIYMQRDRGARWAQHWVWLIGFMGASASVPMIFDWRGIVSAMPALAVCIATWGAWAAAPPVMRILLFTTCLLWLPYSLIVEAYPAATTQVIVGGWLAYNIRRDQTLQRFFRAHLRPS